MPNRLRHRGLMRQRLPRTFRPLSVTILNLVPAIKQAGRHHVEGLEILMNESEHFPQVGQDAPGELIYQEGAVGMQHRMGLAEDRFPKVRRHGGVRYSR